MGFFPLPNQNPTEPTNQIKKILIPLKINGWNLESTQLKSKIIFQNLHFGSHVHFFRVYDCWIFGLQIDASCAFGCGRCMNWKDGLRFKTWKKWDERTRRTLQDFHKRFFGLPDPGKKLSWGVEQNKLRRFLWQHYTKEQPQNNKNHHTSSNDNMWNNRDDGIHQNHHHHPHHPHDHPPPPPPPPPHHHHHPDFLQSSLNHGWDSGMRAATRLSGGGVFGWVAGKGTSWILMTSHHSSLYIYIYIYIWVRVARSWSPPPHPHGMVPHSTSSNSSSTSASTT